MNKTYSISEIVEATNNILNRPQKNSQINENYQNNKSAELNKPLVLTNEHIPEKEETLNNEEVKKEILEEIHNYFIEYHDSFRTISSRNICRRRRKRY